MFDYARADLSQTRMESAKEALATAAENMNAGRYKAANNRAYYAMYHAIRAVLALDGAELGEQNKTIEYFNDNYLSSNLLDNYLKVVIEYAKDSCDRCDNEDYYVATHEETLRNISGAGDVLAAADSHIASRLETESIQPVQ